MLDYGIQTVLHAYNTFVGNGDYILLFYVCIIYLFCKESKFSNKTLVYPIVFILFCFALNPIAAQLSKIGLDQNSYYRNYWLLMDIIVISYAAVCLVYSLDSKVKRVLATLAMCAVIALSGRYMFEADSEVYTVPETAFKVPGESAHIANTMKPLNITKDERVLTDELLTNEIRLYDASITLVYSYFLPIFGKVHHEDAEYVESAQLLYDMIYEHTQEFDEELLYKALKETQCKYMIVYNESAVMPELSEIEWLSVAAATDIHEILQVGETDEFD